MADTSHISGGPAVLNDNAFRPKCGATFPVGTPITIVDGQATPGNTTIDGSTARFARLVGIASSPGIASTVSRETNVTVQYAAALKLTVDQWSAVQASGVGLQPGRYYFLDGTGLITVTDPGGGGARVSVGLAIANDTMMVRIGDLSVPG